MSKHQYTALYERLSRDDELQGESKRLRLGRPLLEKMMPVSRYFVRAALPCCWRRAVRFLRKYCSLIRFFSVSWWRILLPPLLNICLYAIANIRK